MGETMTTLEKSARDYAAAMKIIVGYLRENGWLSPTFAQKMAAEILKRLGDAKLILSREEPECS